MNRKFIYYILLFCLFWIYKGTVLQAQPAGRQKFVAAPLCFVENAGQIKDQYGKDRKDVDFRLEAPDVLMFIGNGKVHYQWAKVSNPAEHLSKSYLDDNSEDAPLLETYRMDMYLVGSNCKAQKIVEQPNSFYENHFNIKGTLAGVKANSYQKITYRDIYPNIDWVFYINGNQVEYDFIIRQGGNVRDIRMRYEGASSIEVNGNGSLTARTPMGSLTENAPYSFQADGRKIASSFKLTGNELSFEIADYQGILTIDPVLKWSSYYAGNQLIQGNIVNNVCDPEGNIYYSGTTGSTVNMATAGSFQNTIVGAPYNHILVKFNSDGIRQWGTYYGIVNVTNHYTSIVCDTLGHIYFASIVSDSTANVSTPGAHQTTFGGGMVGGDFFLAKFNAGGQRIWGTLYGGEESEMSNNTGNKLACNGRDVYMCGRTSSFTGIATAGSHKPFYGGGLDDAFLVKFNEHGVRQWGTYYGGIMDDNGASIAIDKKGYVYLAGITSSVDQIATSNSQQSTHANGGTAVLDDAFLVKFDADGNRQWGTYYGGTENELFAAVVCDGDAHVYLSGATYSSTDIATSGGYQPNIRLGSADGFLVQFNESGERQWGTYYGGDSLDVIAGITSDIWNRIYIGGFTKSETGIADANTFQSQYGGTVKNWSGDGFFACFNSKGQKEWSTYFGGKEDDQILATAVDNKGSLYVCGYTMSKDMATKGSHMDTFPIFSALTWYQGLMAKFCVDVPAFIKGPDTVCAYTLQHYKAEASPDVEEYRWEFPSDWEVTGSGNDVEVKPGNQVREAQVRLQIKRCGLLSEWLEYPVYVLPGNPAVIAVKGFILSTTLPFDFYQWMLEGVPIPGATERNYTVTENGNYTVATATTEGCRDTSDMYQVKNVSINAFPDDMAITVFPNPAHSSMLTIASPVLLSIEIYSMDGRLVHTTSETKINTEKINPGLYIMKMRDRKGKYIKTVKWTKL